MYEYKLTNLLPQHDDRLAKSVLMQSPYYALIDSVLYYDNPLNKKRQLHPLPLAVPQHLRQTILEENHGLPTSGHFGYEKVWRRMRAQYFWPNMKGDIKHHVRSCTACAFRQGHSMQHLAPLQSIPTADRPWHSISADLVTLPESRDENVYALVVIDQCSKYCVCRPLPNKYNIVVAQAFEEVITTLGNPANLLTDRGPEFTGSSFQRVLKTYNIAHHKTTSLHPRGNG